MHACSGACDACVDACVFARVWVCVRACLHQRTRVIKCFCCFLEAALHAGGEGPGDHGSAAESPGAGGPGAAAHQRPLGRTLQEEEDVAVPPQPVQ